MSAFIRVIATLLAVLVVSGPVLVALFAASVEPDQPISLAFLVPFVAAGFSSAFGYAVVAFGPQKLVSASYGIRTLAVLSMALSCAAAGYLLVITNSFLVVALSCAVIAGTALLLTACVWPAWLVNPNHSLQPQALTTTKLKR